MEIPSVTGHKPWSCEIPHSTHQKNNSISNCSQKFLIPQEEWREAMKTQSKGERTAAEKRKPQAQPCGPWASSYPFPQSKSPVTPV